MNLLLSEAHSSICAPCEIGVVMLLSFVEDSQVVIKAAPGLSHSVSRSASSDFHRLDIAEVLAGWWSGLRYSRRSRSLFLQQLLAHASTDVGSRD